MWTHRRSGQNNQRNAHDHREPYERDRTRVIHSPSFRRLQDKTQILGMNQGDFHRTRLTHSLEVASIGMSIVRNLTLNPEVNPLCGLLPDDDLMTTISLLHDIGHPPFGHGGEVALNYMMRDHGGFESNGQTLRLLTHLENSYGSYGLDLTRRSLLGILKYPVNRQRVIAPISPFPSMPLKQPIRINDWLPPKAYFDSEQPHIDWLLSSFSPSDINLFQSLRKEPKQRTHGEAAYFSFDCSIMDTADDIAYGVHDLEDAIHLGLITRAQLDTQSFRNHLTQTGISIKPSKLLDKLFSNIIQERKQAIGEIVNYLISSISVTSVNPDFENLLLRHNIHLIPEAHMLLEDLKTCIYRHFIDSQSARIAEHGGQNIIIHLFEAIHSNPSHLLDLKSRQVYENAADEDTAYRTICDYIANLTDSGARKLHERLHGINFVRA